MCQNEVVADLIQEEPSVNDLIRIGMDTSKSVFVLHGVDAAEQPVLRRTLRRRQVIEFFARLPPTQVGMEACGAAHHWARELGALGHEVKLLPAQRVKPYVARNKNDTADAEGVCEAMSRPRMRFVPVKTSEQQAALMLAGMRLSLGWWPPRGSTRSSRCWRGLLRMQRCRRWPGSCSPCWAKNTPSSS